MPVHIQGLLLMIYHDDYVSDDSDSANVNLLHPLEHGVNDNEGPGPPNPRAAVSHYWPRVRWVQHMDPGQDKN